jgi:hypothetical protein
MKCQHILHAALFAWVIGSAALAQPNQVDVRLTLRLAATSNSLTLVHKETITRQAAADEATKRRSRIAGAGIVGVLGREVGHPIGELGSDAPTPTGTRDSSPAAGMRGGPPIAKTDDANSIATLAITASPEINGRAITVNAKIVSLNTVVEKFPDETDADYKARRLAFKQKALDEANAMVQSLGQNPLSLSDEEERTLIRQTPVAKDLPAPYFEDNKQNLVITVTCSGLSIDGKLGS